MLLRAFCCLALLFSFSPVIAAEWVVTSVADLPDEDLTDNIYTPQTLRSAIQNAVQAGVPATIRVSDVIEKQTIKLTRDLPVISVPTILIGKGIVLEPAAGSLAQNGLIFTSDYSTVRDVMIQGFPGSGLLWQGDDGLIELMIIRNNGSAGINLNGANRNVIGSRSVRGYYSNYIYGQTGEGSGHGIVMIVDSRNNVVQYTAIGVDDQGTPRGNNGSGIYTESIGGEFHHNLISGNKGNGIEVFGDNFPLVSNIYGNKIGTDIQGNAMIPNLKHGISMLFTAADTIRDNLVSGNMGVGIYVSQAKAVFIHHNRVGITYANDGPLSNNSGMSIAGELHTVTDNVISGNRAYGISISGKDMIFEHNIIGLDSTQQRVIGNGAAGVYCIQMQGLIGDFTSTNANIIAGNGGAGIEYGGSKSFGGVIAGNIIGTNKALKLNAPNVGSGVLLHHDVSAVEVFYNIIAFSNRHGVEVERNVVSFTDTTKPSIIQKPHGIWITDNRIGYSLIDDDSAGMIVGSGISILNADSIYINRNRIYACQADGITIANDSTRIVSIHDNDIGTPQFTRFKRVIKGNGINIKGAIIVEIGALNDPDLGNRIHYCEGFAIRADNPTEAMDIYQNFTCGNVNGGIELDRAGFYYQFLSNDAFDQDWDGANEYQNTPDMAYARVVDGVGHIKGLMEGRPGTQYRFDVYLERVHPAAAHHRTQGCIPVGSFMQNTDFRGVVRLDRLWGHANLAAFGKDYPVITLTATGIEGTSQFSLPHTTILPPDDTSGVDVAVYIDTIRTGVDVNGDVHLYATIINLGFGVATNISVADSLLGAFVVDSARIERGLTTITPEKVTATLTSLGIGESVEYYAKGRALQLGTHRRAVVAIPADLDMRPRNNIDTIDISPDVINGVAASNHADVRISSRDAQISITSLSGPLSAWVSDLAGRAVGSGSGENFSMSCAPGVYILRVLSTASALSHSLIIVE